MKTIKIIKEIIEKGEFEYYGLRKDNRNYEIGEELEVSHEWYQDPEYCPETDELVYPFDEDMKLYDAGELEGTCAIEIEEDDIEDIINHMGMYEGENLYLIASDCVNIGNDCNEIIMEDAVVIVKL